MKTWNSIELLQSVKPILPETASISPDELKEFFWMDLCAEYDSIRLYQEIQKRKHRYHPEFLEFVDAWYLDEQNHARGFARIYELFFGTPPQELFDRLNQRPSDFSLIESYLDDEFKLLCLLAYDELATTHTYHKDIEFYRQFDRAELNEWIHLLKRDEALHYSRCMRLIRQFHADRCHEIQTILDDILRIDLNNDQYRATFVLDHSPDCTHFQLDGHELTQTCAQFISRKLQKVAAERIAVCG